MRLRWFGQSAFLLTGPEGTVMIHPFGDGSALAGRGIRYRTPAIGFLDPVDPFLEAFDDVRRLDGPEAEIDRAARPERPLVLVPSPSGAR